MATRGRKPLPTALKELEGDRGKGRRPLNKDEPTPPQDNVKCPAWLMPEAKKEWKRLAPSLIAMGVLTEHDMEAFAGYCQAYARWREAEEFLSQHGTIFKTPSGYVQQVPQVSIAMQNLKIIRWMPMDKWDECGGAVNEYELEGRACYAGLDLSSTSDQTAMVLVFPPRDDEEQYIVLPYFWLPEETMQLRVRRDHVMYDKWERQGFIHTTEGNVVHYGFIEQFITKLGERFNIREIAYDRWNATMMVQTLEDDGFNMVPFGQGFRDMSPPTKELMRIVLERKLNHGGHPVLRWNMDNTFVRTDPAGNLKIDKEKSTEKVDGAVALVMALDRAMKNQGGESVYDTRGLLII